MGGPPPNRIRPQVQPGFVTVPKLSMAQIETLGSPSFIHSAEIVIMEKEDSRME